MSNDICVLGYMTHPVQAHILHVEKIDAMQMHVFLRQHREAWEAHGPVPRLVLLADTEVQARPVQLKVLGKAIALSQFELAGIVGPAATAWAEAMGVSVIDSKPRIALEAPAVLRREAWKKKHEVAATKATSPEEVAQLTQLVQSCLQHVDNRRDELLEKARPAADNTVLDVVVSQDVQVLSVTPDNAAEDANAVSINDTSSASETFAHLEPGLHDTLPVGTQADLFSGGSEDNTEIPAIVAEDTVVSDMADDQGDLFLDNHTFNAPLQTAERSEVIEPVYSADTTETPVVDEQSVVEAVAVVAEAPVATEQAADDIGQYVAEDFLSLVPSVLQVSSEAAGDKTDSLPDTLWNGFPPSDEWLLDSVPVREAQTGFWASIQDEDIGMDDAGQEISSVETRVVVVENVKPLRHRGRMRSGQLLTHPGDIIVEGSLNSGGEIVAGGDVHVYGTAGGRLLAGVTGDRSACIYVQAFDAELISIAGQYHVFEDVPAHWAGRSLKIYLLDGAIHFEELLAMPQVA